MKTRIVKKITSLLVGAMVLMSLSASVLAADSSVNYEGGAEKFVFLPGSEYTDTDLFDNFKKVMPGDTITQKVIVKNNFKNCDYVKIYMRAEAHDEAENPLSENVAATGENVASMSDFLSQLSMTIRNGSEVIYEASPDELDGLQENILLGSFENGDSAELTVELKVPIELGNEYAYRVGEVDWVFVVEELNNPEPENPPATGDQAQIGLYIGLMAASLCGIAVILFIKARKTKA